MIRLVTIVYVLTLVGCATSVIPTSTGGSRADGVIEMSYEYGQFEQPKVDKAAALASAVRRCKTWGYVGAESFESGLKNCVQASSMGCARYRVTTEYQCIHASDGAIAPQAASQEKYSTQVRSVAESMECTESATMVAANEDSEKWVLGCGDGETLEVRCFDENCYVK